MIGSFSSSRPRPRSRTANTAQDSRRKPIDAIAAGSPASVIEQQQQTAARLVEEYVEYVWDGAEKPGWVTQAGL
jgi:hypothetical protein